MARNKEAVVLLLDVGPSMHSVLPEVERVCSMLIQKKLIFGKYDEVGVVLFGTEETNNELTNEVGGYEHVAVLQHIKVVDADLIKALEKLPRGTANGDYEVIFEGSKITPQSLGYAFLNYSLLESLTLVVVLDAIVVGMDMLIKKFGPTNKGKKRLCLVTNAVYPIKDPYEGTKEDQVNTIAAQMTAHGMKMEGIVFRGKQNDNANKTVMEENDHLLNVFSERTASKTVHVQSSTSLLGAVRTRNISPVTIYRGDFELSPKMKIKAGFTSIRCYPLSCIPCLKQAGNSFLALVRVKSKVSQQLEAFRGHALEFLTLSIGLEGNACWGKLLLNLVWVYKKTSEEKFPTLKKYSDKAPSTDRFATHEIKVDYEYKSVEDPGKVVPPEQRIKGFCYGPQVVPISSAELETVKFKPEKSVKLLGFTDAANIMRNTKAILAVSALARAMKEMNKVAIVRCVWQQGQGNVVVGVLTPNLSDKAIPDSFYFNILPFADDIREFQFPSFSNFSSSFQPNEQQQEAADNLVKMLDLAPAGEEEALQPDFTPNPVLERFYHLELRSRHPDAALTPLDDTLKKITEPDPELISRNKSVIDEFRRLFELKENPKLKKSNRRLLRDRPSGSNEEGQGLGNDNDDEGVTALVSTSTVKVDKIGDSTPVQDFEAMMSCRDSPEWISKAIEEMKRKIVNLVEDSCDGDTYQKALELLAALHNGCILEQVILLAVSTFGFEITEDEARSFVVKSEPKSEQGL
ncbi:hypothetical protein RJ639_031719 [Escallonia herrerae]|uniref:Ku domain-containing protein n=1 Tax=Escallonia herrerae TaxID=1293975 RepID=A0AA88WXN7_9ASTE|nr:hypothetical protein RJ639_031719 [Escallonia herrerae]